MTVQLARAFEFKRWGGVNWLEFSCRKADDAVATPNSKFKYQLSGPTSLFLLSDGPKPARHRLHAYAKLRIAGHGVVFLRQSSQRGRPGQGPKQHAR
jgi:hypothetical protein